MKSPSWLQRRITMVPSVDHYRAFPSKQPSWTCQTLSWTFLLVHLALILLSSLTVALPTASSTGSCLLTVDNQCNSDGSQCTLCGSCINAMCVVAPNSTTPSPQGCSLCDNVTQICWGGGCIERAGNGIRGAVFAHDFFFFFSIEYTKRAITIGFGERSLALM